LKFNSYPVSLLIFRFFPLVVYPVGVTTCWYYFIHLWLFMVLHPNLVSGWYHYPAFQCTKFQGNWVMLLCFVTTFTPWQKEEKKTHDNFQGFISRKRLAWFSWNLECEVMTLACISTAKSFIRENCIIVLPVNKSRVLHTNFLGCMTHYHVSWYIRYSCDMGMRSKGIHFRQSLNAPCYKYYVTLIRLIACTRWSITQANMNASTGPACLKILIVDQQLLHLFIINGQILKNFSYVSLLF